MEVEVKSRLKKVLLIDRFYFPDEQATAIYLTELTEGLQNQFEFEVLCGPPRVVTERSISGCPASRVHQVACLNLSKRFLWTRALNDFSFLLSAFFHGLFLNRPHLVVSQTSPPGIWWVGFLLSRWHRTRWIHVCQDIFPDNLKPLIPCRSERLFHFFDRLSSFPLKRAGRILVVGEDMKKRLLKKGFSPQQVVLTSNWVDLEFIHPLSKRNSFSEKYQLTEKFVVLYAGNFGRVHNFEDLLDAAESLRGHPEIFFVLVGEGALKRKLTRECGSRKLTNISLVPFEPRSKLPEVLAAADVSIILLRKGMAGLSLPSKIYSVLASGRPVLACVEEESDIARLVRDSNSGFVVPPANPRELTRVLVNLFENSELRRQLGLNARRFAEEKNFKALALQTYGRAFREVIHESEKTF